MYIPSTGTCFVHCEPKFPQTESCSRYTVALSTVALIVQNVKIPEHGHKMVYNQKQFQTTINMWKLFTFSLCYVLFFHPTNMICQLLLTVLKEMAMVSKCLCYNRTILARLEIKTIYLQLFLRGSFVSSMPLLVTGPRCTFPSRGGIA